MSFDLIPSVVAMLVCDQIINEQGTNKKSLIGVFQRVYSSSFPVLIPKLGVYIKLVDVVGKRSFTLRIVKLEDESLVTELKADIELPDESQPAELAINMQNFPFHSRGKYEFQLYAGEVYLHRTTVDAVLLDEGGPQ